MLHIELPMINVLSKVDLVKRMFRSSDTGDGESDSVWQQFGIKFCTSGEDLWRLTELIKESSTNKSERYRKMTEQLCDILDEGNGIHFTTLNVNVRVSPSLPIARVASFTYSFSQYT